jgi:hypothetical protein
MKTTSRDLFELTLKDFFTKKMLTISTIPLIFVVVLLTLFLSFVAEDIVVSIQPYFKVDESSWFFTIIPSGIVEVIAEFLFYIFGTIFILLASIFLGLIVIGFLTPYIIRSIQKRGYADFNLKGYGSFFDSLLYIIKIVAISLILGIVLIPFYFIPLLNIVVINIPFFFLFHNLLIYDVSTTVAGKKEAEIIYKVNKMQLYGITTILYSVSLIPFLGIFLQVFFVILLGHFYIKESIELREVREY